MNRRIFLKRSVLAVGISVVPLYVTGCSVNPTELLNTLIQAGQGLLKVAEPNAVWVPQLSSALNALQSAEASWKSGSKVQVVESALNTIEVVIATIPLTAVYSPLVDILVAAIDETLNVLNPNSVGAPVGSLAVRRNRVKLRKPGVLQTQVGAIKSQWNDTAKGLGLTQAKI